MQPEQPMRLFLGFPVSTDCVLELMSRIQAACPEVAQWVRWIKPENGHITLRFLGDLPCEKVPSLTEALQAALEGEGRAFTLSIRSLAHFPHANSRIIAALMPAIGALLTLSQQAEAVLEAFAFKPDKHPLRPHITLAKRHPGRTECIEPIAMDGLTLRVEACILYHSKPAERGHDYIPLARFSLL